MEKPHDGPEIPLELEDRRGSAANGDGSAADGSAVPGAGRRPWLWTRLLLAAVLVLIAWETWATFHQHKSTPSEQGWRAAASRVREKRQKGEPVLFAPLWVEPLGRYHLAGQLPLELMLLSDVDRHARVWEVSVRGARHPWLAGLAPARSWSSGGVTVALFEKRPVKVLYDFTRSIRQAQVQRKGAESRPCPRQDGRFKCDPARSWNWVGPHLAEVGHRPYRCIFAHPVDGHVIRITFPDALLGSTLVGYTGIDDFENRKRAALWVQLRVLVGDRLLGTVRHENQWPWQRFVLDTRTNAGQTHAVHFEVTAPGAYARTFCFAAETRQ